MTRSVHYPYAKDGVCPCELFECPACHLTKPACAGGDADEIDPAGALCTDCWFLRCRAKARATEVTQP